MEEIAQFESILKNYTPIEVEYMAVFNPETGEVMKVGPSYAFENEKYKLSIDKEVAMRIIEGEVRISACVVNVHTNELEMAETKVVYKIDDVLHRIVDKRWTDVTKPDVYITYDDAKNELIFELSAELGGTKHLENQEESIVPRKIIWAGDTEMSFLITEYNDPNILHEMFSMRIDELLGKSKTIKNLSMPKRFSVYTRRLFANYIIEVV